MIRWVLVVATIGATLLSAPASRAGDPEAGKAKAEEAGCAECHGRLGVSADPIIPNLAGQNEEYLIKQLNEFRQSPSLRRLPTRQARRSHHIMDRQAETLNDADVANLAAWFTTLWCDSSGKETTVAPPKITARCTSCHGPSGMSEEGIIPKLAGQNQAYLAKQLRLFRESAQGPAPEGAESERFHSLMDNETVALSDAAIDALDSYFAGQSCW